MSTPTSPALHHDRSNHWHWRLTEPFVDPLLEVTTRWDRVEELAGARELKSNLSRTVIELPATATRPALIVKRYHVRGPRERSKYLLLPSRARAEWRALHHLRKNGVQVPSVLAFGERRSGVFLQAAGLILERVPDILALPQWLETAEDEGARARVLNSLGGEIARLHDSGCDHTDLHGGNVLVHRDGGRVERPVTLIDHHVVKVVSFVPEWRRISNLSRLVHSLRGCVAFTSMLAFLDGYDSARRVPHWTDHARVLEKLESGARRIEDTRLRSRSKRCWKNSSLFARERQGDLLVHRRREVSSEDMVRFVERGLVLDPVLKERRGYRVGVSSLEVNGETTNVVVKIHEPRGLKRLQGLFGRGPLERGWGAARALDVREIANPRALALIVQSRWGIPVRSVLITEYQEGAVPLHQDLLDRYWPLSSVGTLDLRGRIPLIADLLRRLHDSGIYHRDLNPMNLLVTTPGGDGEELFSLIDLDSVVPRRRLTDQRRRRNLVQLGLLPEGHIPGRERLRFLRAYDRDEGRYWTSEWIRAIDRDLADETVRVIARMSRQEKRAKSGTFIGDPRFGSERSEES